MLSISPEVRAKFDQSVYALPLVLIVLFGWTSLGLSMLTQAQARMSSASWHYHIVLTSWAPITPTEVWGLIWLATSFAVGLSCLRSVRALKLALYVAAVIPLSWVCLFVASAIAFPVAGLTGATAYAVLALLAFVAGKGLSS